MEERIKDEVIYYYDWHPTEEDLMGESNPHLDLVTYLVTLLRYLFRDQPCAVYGNLNFYQTRNPHEYPLAPDVAVIKGAAYDPFVISWKVGQDRPAPQVVFEILSKETWSKDLAEKPALYGRLGVREYFVYDPNVPPLSSVTARRLFGWQFNSVLQQMTALPLVANGSLWSWELDSFLLPDQDMLRLYDRQWHRRFTEAEARAQQAEAEAAARQVAERQARMEAEARRVAERRAQALAEMLRSLGIDPDPL